MCLTGELRSLIFPVVQLRLNQTLLEPLQADAYLVASRRWTRAQNLPLRGGRLTRPWYEHSPEPVSEANVTRIRATLPGIRNAIIAEDDALWSIASGWMDSQPKRSDNARLIRNRCNWSATQRLPWQRELCHTRVTNAIRMRLCLMLMEDAEASSRKPYQFVIRTRPDVWLDCILTRAALTTMPTNYAAYSWDHLAILSRAAATTSLRELELSPAVPICSYPNGVEQCNPCLLRKYGFNIISLLMKADVARQCQLLSHEKRGVTCRGFSGPLRGGSMDIIRACPKIDTRRYLYGMLKFPSKAGCDGDGNLFEQQIEGQTNTRRIG